MRYIKLLVFLFYFTGCFGQKSSIEKYDLAYFRDNKGSFVIQLNTKQERLIPEAYDPCISADGLKIVYTKYSSGIKSINVLDLKTSKETMLNVSSDKLINPLWSPDNKHIIFILKKDNVLKIGIIGIDNSNFKIFKNSSYLYSPTWTLDGQSIIAHDFNYIFKFNLNGEIIEKLEIDTPTKGAPLSSDTRFLFTSDNKFVIWNGGIHEYYPGSEGPDEAIFAYNFETRERIQLSPKGIIAFDPFINSNNEIYFTGYKGYKEIGKIYKIDLYSKEMTLVIDSAKQPTCRNLKF
jgi:Tol biopolymer transport system component